MNTFLNTVQEGRLFTLIQNPYQNPYYMPNITREKHEYVTNSHNAICLVYDDRLKDFLGVNEFPIIEQPITFTKGEHIALSSTACDGFEPEKKVYEIVAVVDSYKNIPLNGVVVRQISGEAQAIFELNKQDCHNIGIEFEHHLQMFPRSMEWLKHNDVAQEYIFNPYDIHTYPRTNGVLKKVLLKVSNFHSYRESHIFTPNGNIILANDFIQSFYCIAKNSNSAAPILLGNFDRLPTRIVTQQLRNIGYLPNNNEGFLCENNDIYFICDFSQININHEIFRNRIDYAIAVIFNDISPF